MSMKGPKSLVSQQSTVWMRKQHAVCVRRAIKKYGDKKAPHVILDELNMTVPKGCIYGLLGASGCGKTTLLSCVVGRRRLDSGEIWVLGGKPGSRGSGVPGPRIGYMPQELALYGEFSIRESLIYFGWVNGMTSKEVNKEIDFYIDLLKLPHADRLIKTLSGGQQRRVSLAVTLIHKPELLILDEPTVGVDPVLRTTIWDYMVKMTTEYKTTIIITTHYIDETRQAHTIGLMRGGKLLAEESPNSLLQRYNSDSLEDVFLRLAIMHNKGKRRRSSIISDVVAAVASSLPNLKDDIISLNNDVFDAQSEISGEFGDNMSIKNVRLGSSAEAPVDPVPPDDEVDVSWRNYISFFNKDHLKALVWKDVYWMFRNWQTMLFVFSLPIIQTILLCYTIGRDPEGLKIGYINHEVPFGDQCTFNETVCSYERFSCRFIKHMENKHHIMVQYKDEESAINAVKKNDVWAYVEMQQFFSQMMTARINAGRSANETVIDGSEVITSIDMSNMQIAYLIRKDILSSLILLAQDLAKNCNENVAGISYPIKFNDPVYGFSYPNFRDFAAPGVILTMAFFLAVALASVTMIVERNEGILERSLVIGITGNEILFGHVVTQFVVLICQGLSIVFISIYIFDVVNLGNIGLVLSIVICCGLSGMTFGFLISTACDNERSATYFSLGSFFPFVMLCGVCWPVEGMHKFLKWISTYLPLTLTTESLRSVMSRGWTIDKPQVYFGFISLLIWTLIFASITLLLIKFRRG